MVPQAEANGIQVILATIPPWGGDDWKRALAECADSSPTRRQRIEKLNQWIEGFGAEYHLAVVDYLGYFRAPHYRGTPYPRAIVPLSPTDADIELRPVGPRNRREPHHENICSVSAFGLHRDGLWAGRNGAE
jgi:hypothetical protein